MLQVHDLSIKQASLIVLHHFQHHFHHITATVQYSCNLLAHQNYARSLKCMAQGPSHNKRAMMALNHSLYSFDKINPIFTQGP